MPDRWSWGFPFALLLMAGVSGALLARFYARGWWGRDRR